MLAKIIPNRASTNKIECLRPYCDESKEDSPSSETISRHNFKCFFCYPLMVAPSELAVNLKRLVGNYLLGSLV